MTRLCVRIEQVKGLKEEKENALQDKENIQNKCEKQINELCATLEKYKVSILRKNIKDCYNL